MQTIGTHNSYHVTPDDALRKLLTRSSVRALLGSEAAAQIPSSWEATQAPLGTQLSQYGAQSLMCGNSRSPKQVPAVVEGAVRAPDLATSRQRGAPDTTTPGDPRLAGLHPISYVARCASLPAGVRQLELDAYPDPQGDLFRASAGRKLAGENGFLPIPALRRPGWKVVHLKRQCHLMLSRNRKNRACSAQPLRPSCPLSQQVLHVPDIDFNSTVWTFVEGLQAIKVLQWLLLLKMTESLSVSTLCRYHSPPLHWACRSTLLKHPCSTAQHSPLMQMWRVCRPTATKTLRTSRSRSMWSSRPTTCRHMSGRLGRSWRRSF